jgi:hypothetical protein
VGPRHCLAEGTGGYHRAEPLPAAGRSAPGRTRSGYSPQNLGFFQAQKMGT